MRMRRLSAALRQNFAPLLLLVLGMLSLTWFRGHLIDQGDFVFPLNRFDYFYATLSQWDPRWSFGAFSPTQAAALPFATLGAVTQLLGVPLLVFEEFMFYVWFTAAGLSMYYLCRTFNLENPVAALAGVVYMMNPFTLIIIWQVGQGQLQIAYASAPLALASYRGFVANGDLRRLMALTLSWLAIGGPSSFVNPGYLAIFSIPCVVLFAFGVGKGAILRNLNGVRTVVTRSIEAVIVFMLANFFWLLPVSSSIGAQLASLGQGQAPFGSLLYNYNLASANLIDSVRLLGYWALNESAAYGPYYQWGFEYFQMPLLALSFAAPFLASLALLSRPRRVSLFFGVLLAVGLFLIGGADPPFATVNLYLFSHVALFQAFQEAFERFGFLTALSMAPLVGIGIQSVHKSLHGNVLSSHLSRIRPLIAKFVTISLLLVILGANVFPFWSGEVIQSPAVSALSPRVNIPSDFYALRQFTETGDPGVRILSLPLTNSYNAVYNWPGGGYTGSDPTVWYSAVPTIMINNNNLTELIKEGQLGAFGPSTFGKMLALSGVKYIVYHTDANFELLGGAEGGLVASSGLLTDFLSNFEKVQTLGNISVYLNSYTPYPKIYTPSQLYLLNDTQKGMINILDALPIEPTIGTVSCSPATTNCELLENLSAGSVQATLGSPLLSAYYVPVPGNYTLLVPKSYALANLGNAALWTQNSSATDNYKLGASKIMSSMETLVWTIDRSVGGMRGIVFRGGFQNVTEWTRMSIWVNGDDSGNELILQLYDSSGKYIAFTQNIDWEGWRLLTFALSQPKYVSNQGNFDYTNIASATLYYANSVEAGANSSIEIGAPETETGFAASTFQLTEGVHMTNSSGDFVLLSQNSNPKRFPTVSFSHLGANRFSIDVTNATGPFPLIFDETFSSDWKLCASGYGASVGLPEQCVPESNHFVANDYANGWLVNRTGSFSLTIFFVPDIVGNYALAVSIVAWIVMVLLVVERKEMSKLLTWMRRPSRKVHATL